MHLVDAQLTASQVLRAFHHDEPYLFLGAAFTTVGLVSAALCVIRRKYDPLLLWFAAFAILYGQRLWLNAEILAITLPDSHFLQTLRFGMNFIVPIPAFFFFETFGLLGLTARLSPTETADHIISTIQTWSATQNDDLTVLICDYIA